MEHDQSIRTTEMSIAAIKTTLPYKQYYKILVLFLIRMRSIFLLFHENKNCLLVPNKCED
jgi:hypothetical protein